MAQFCLARTMKPRSSTARMFPAYNPPNGRRRRSLGQATCCDVDGHHSPSLCV